MKNAPMYGLDGPVVNAFQKKDLDPEILEQADTLWWKEWVLQGEQDEGTCCLGKGLEVQYLSKGRRVAEWCNIVNFNYVQGNVTAQKTYGPALKFLKENGIEARYNDGNMD